jgi:conjugative relaxase-like TrwC/TraI family protein
LVVVVMRVTTLKASAAKLPGLLAYYAGLAEDREQPGSGRGPVDYYLDPDEPPGRWTGGGRHALGLGRNVEGAQLRALLDAAHPETGGALGRRFGDSSARGFDATFSAPKSVSVLWALSPDPFVRAEVLASHDAAVDAALGWFERHGAVTRRGTDGVFQVDTLGVTAAVFRQHTSRTVDPQLHSHAIISAKVQDDTGQWLALDARFLKYQQRSIGWVYDAALRAELTARLGVTWVDRGDGVFDLACVPETLREAFSSRTQQVEVKLAELVRAWSDAHDGADPEPRTAARLERDAVLDSRPDKVHGFDPTELHAHWRAEAHAAGFDGARLVAEQVRDSSTSLRRSDGELIAVALGRVSEESAAWLRADIARHLATLLAPELTGSAAELVAEVDRLAAFAEQQCVPLGPERDTAARCRADGRPVTEAVTDRRLTTPAVLTQEQALQTWATRTSRPVDPSDDPQLDAARAIAGHDRLVLVVGPAGTGKTYITARAVASLHAQGRPVVGLAPSGKAADVLATAAGCQTDTLAGFLTRHPNTASRWPSGTTIILDEAGMAATADLARLVHLAQTNQWRLVAVGDPEQLPAVGRGGAFAHWCDTLPRHTLDTPRRFEHQWEARASLALRAGRPDAADAYVTHGRVHSAHPATIPSRVAQAHGRHVQGGRSVAITTTNSEMARAINREIQYLAHPRTVRGVPLRDNTIAQAGDQIATRRNDPKLWTHLGHQVRNRHLWTVTDTHADGSLTVAHPDRGTVDLPADYVARHVELGWAVTGYGNQGDTVDIGIAVLEPSTTRNHAYVAMTRGRHANHALMVDPTGVLDPGEQLAEIITRPAAADSALAVQARLHRDAGLEPPDPIAATQAAIADLQRANTVLNAADAPKPGEPIPASPIAPTKLPPPTRSTGHSLGL